MTAELLKIVLVADVSDRHQIQKILQQLNQTQIELMAIASLDDIKLHQCVSYQAGTVILLVISRLDAYGLKVVNQVRHIYAGFPLITIGDAQNQALICEAISLGVQEYLIAEQVTGTILLQKLQFANARWQWLGKRFEDLQKLQNTSKVSLHSPLKECCCRAENQRISILAETNTFHQIVTHCNDAIAIIDLQGYYLEQNAMHQLLLGYSDEDLDGKTPAIHLGEQVFSTVCQQLVKNDCYCGELLSRTKSGKLIHIELKAFTVRDKRNQPVYYVGIKKDITERKLVTSVVTQRDRLLEGVAAATNQLLITKNFTQAIYQALATLGKAVEVNRVYVFENHTDPHSGEPLLSQRFEWTDTTVTPEIDNPELQNLSYLKFLPRWYQILALGKIICGLVKDFPESERQILEPQNIISILIVPIFIEDLFWGFVGFDECRYQRQWQESEEAILTAVAGSIGAAIVRKRTEETLRKTEARNRALLDAIPDAMFRLRNDGKILDFKRAKNFDPYIPENEFLGKNLTDILPEIVSQQIMLSIKQTLTNGIQKIEYQLPIQGKVCDYEARMVVCGEDEVVSIVRDISERKQVEIELRKSKEAVENVSKAKSEFLATMSHELRTPLNAILGLSQLLHQEIFGSLNAKQKEYVSCIYSSGEHLLSLINDILDLSKVEAGKEELMLALVQVPELCETCLAIVRDRAIKKGLQLTSQLDPQAVCCFADERRVKQMLLNLLTNAIKFTPSGKVTLLVQKVPQGITFTVSDTGIGIASEHLKLLFQPFKQLDSRFNRQYEGTGLGLALTRKLAHLHGGNVTVKSTLGKGSDFTLLLPDYPQPTEDEQYGYNQQAGHLFNCSPRILISGNGNHGSIIQSYLKAIGYEVKYLKVTNNILAQIEKFKPKLILLDTQLPENVTTVTLIQHLKAELDQTIPIVVITETTEKCDRFLEAGAQECLNKPIGIAQLESLLMRYL